MIDAISSAALLSMTFEHWHHNYAAAFPHPCTVLDEYCRHAPIVVDDQKLHFLHHRIGQNSIGKTFAYCPHCTKTWTNEEFIESYLMNVVKVPGLTCYPDNNVKRLKAMAVRHQKEGNITPVVIDAGSNLHGHTWSCFDCKECVPKNGSNTQKQKCSHKDGDECHYHYPAHKKWRTVVQNVSSDPVRWYHWDGSFEERHIKEICMKRHHYDAFQNVCCPTVSHSRLACNSNIVGLMPGPVGQYSFKYFLKDTQKDDLEAYTYMSEASHKALNAAQSHTSDRSESIRRLLAASHVHQQKQHLAWHHGIIFNTKQAEIYIFAQNCLVSTERLRVNLEWWSSLHNNFASRHHSILSDCSTALLMSTIRIGAD